MPEDGQTQGHEIAVNLEDEMKTSYLEYAMSVIIGRALPDVRDGLKPVHRRVLYSMQENSNTFNRPYKKSARIVGDVIGKYHPHGDTAVYDTIVRMAQDFSMRELLVDGQGNFGSVDGDSPAAMRYTEVRMTRLAGDLLADLDKETVDFVPTYDGDGREPVVLPSRVPNLLINGASGIAVGMATNIPPHNLSEVIEACLLLLDHPSAGLEELLELVPGPDFPTGAAIFGKEAIRQAYSTGRGIVRMRAVTDFEDIGGNRQAIIVNELPYLVNKAKLIEKIAHLVHEKKIEGISDLRDESDRRGMRVVIELKRGEQPEIVLNQLFKMTYLQSSFGINMLAIVEGKPQVLSLSQSLNYFLDHRKEVVRRRTLYDLDKAKNREHILEGLVKALDILDEIIDLVRAADAPETARSQLVDRFDFTPVQAQAILDMRLQRLTGLEREKIISELQDVRRQIEELQAILSSEEVLKEVIREELQQVKESYGNPRRTQILDYEGGITMEDLIADEPVVITVTRAGYIKRTALNVYRAQHRGGKGRIGMATKSSDDLIDYLFIASTHSYILIFTDKGRVYWLKVWEIPDVGAAGRGKPIINLIQVQSEEKIAGMIAVADFEKPGNVVMVSRQGYIKKTALKAYSNPRVAGIIACGVAEDDALHSVAFTEGDNDILLGSRQGQAIRFGESDVRAMGRTARGVIGIRLRKGDEVVALRVIRDENVDVLAVKANGFGKRTPVEEYPRQGRGGYGVINVKTTDKDDEVVGVSLVDEESEIVLITTRGKIIRMPALQIRRTATRSTLGVKVIDLGAEDQVAALTLVPPEEEGEEAEGAEAPDQEVAVDESEEPSATLETPEDAQQDPGDEDSSAESDQDDEQD
ncbi:MAG TPA: DNA gyrase subunit A [Acidobacteriota bacterium]|nr:DNA gyrase subunit A [Acidobacteriota bacterium]